MNIEEARFRNAWFEGGEIGKEIDRLIKLPHEQRPEITIISTSNRPYPPMRIVAIRKEGICFAVDATDSRGFAYILHWPAQKSVSRNNPIRLSIYDDPKVLEPTIKSLGVIEPVVTHHL